MSADTYLNVYLKSDSSRWGIGLGIMVSLIVHLAIAVIFFSESKQKVSPPPPAIPVAIKLVAPIAAPEFKSNDSHEDTEQPQTKQSHQAKAPKIQPKPVEKKVAKKPVKKQPPPKPIRTAKVDKPSELKHTEQEKPKPKQMVSKTVIASPPREVVQAQAVKVASEVNNQKQKQDSVAQVATAKASVKTVKQSQQISALQTGAMSMQGKQAKMNWQRILHAHLERHKQYPRKAKRMRQQGMPIIMFTINRKGEVLGASLVKSSGTISLDNEALALVSRAQPLPKPPKNIEGDNLTLTLPIRFSM